MRLRGRPLSAGEAALAREVFGAALDPGRVRLHRAGLGPFAVTLGRRVFFAEAAWRDDFAAGAGSPWADLGAQALLVHELVHVWQFRTRPLWTLASWAGVALRGGYGAGSPGYRYALPVAFDRLNLEQQASAVEHAFLFARGVRPGRAPEGATLRDYAGRTPFPKLTLPP
jgi:hypothetical protein